MNYLSTRFLLILCHLITAGVSVSAQHKPAPQQPQENLIWDSKPASNWMKEAYPIGNGRMGAMVFGGVATEHIQFNENSLWTGDERETGRYQAFGDLFIDFDKKNVVNGQEEQYKRRLNIQKALHTISYSQNGTNFQREYFCSFPAKAIILKFSADKKGAYSATIRLKDAHGSHVTLKAGLLQFNGVLENGMRYHAAASIVTNGGALKFNRDSAGNAVLVVSDADGITIALTAATNFISNRAMHWIGEDPSLKVKSCLQNALKKGYVQLRTEHIADYKALYNRVSLDLGHTSFNHLPTAKRIELYQRDHDPRLASLLFQYGRYLLISSSRKGGLPANLQGLWNDSNDPPWRSDYHSNINIQMNYWPAEMTNLSECHFPYLDYINSIREVAKENSQSQYPGVRGWTVRTENNIFGGSSFTWNTPGSAWYAQGLWEHYAFTKDKGYLKEFAYPIIKEIVEFWDDYLKRRPDGVLVSPKGWSPEHGPTEDGVTYDQEIIYDLFTNYIESATILSVDTSYKSHVIDLKAHLLGPKIGKWGQLQEWETDRDDPEDKHRHVSHLFALHPGRQISLFKTPDLFKAAEVSLLARGDASTGWSMAWKMNFWARLKNGEHAYAILNNFIRPAEGSTVDYDNGGGVYHNLLCAHPPFQIDGNLGYTAGVAEMLVQSHTGEIQILPALPIQWSSGRVTGLKARGNFEIVDLQWHSGKIQKLILKSLAGEPCQIRSPNRLQTPGAVIKGFADHGKYVYRFISSKSRIYTFKAVEQ